MHRTRAFPSLPNPDQGRVRTHLAKLRSLPAEFYEPVMPRALPAEYFVEETPAFQPAVNLANTPDGEVLPEVPLLAGPRGIMA